MEIPAPVLESPLIYSHQLSTIISHPVYLKLENVLPCNSFKIRGITSLCKEKVKAGYKGFITFSGGNAGIVLAYTASSMNMPCHIVVPSFVSSRIVEKMKTFGANISVAPSAKEADLQATAMAQNDKTLALIHPYDDPHIWSGYSAIVKEMKDQLKGKRPGCVVLSVGGAGLLTGILLGFAAEEWKDIPIVAMETFGAHSLNKSVKEGKIIENVLTSVAKTLGAASVTPKVMELLNDSDYKVISEVLPDKDAVSACLRFADDHAFLVEPSCGVSLATVYSNVLPGILEQNGVVLENNAPVVIIVCGGLDTNPDILFEYAKMVGLRSSE